LEDLAWLGGNLVDTGQILVYLMTRKGRGDIPLDADNEDELGLIGNVVLAVLLRKTRETDLLALCITVLLDVGFGALKDDTTLFLLGL